MERHEIKSMIYRLRGSEIEREREIEREKLVFDNFMSYGRPHLAVVKSVAPFIMNAKLLSIDFELAGVNINGAWIWLETTLLKWINKNEVTYKRVDTER